MSLIPCIVITVGTSISVYVSDMFRNLSMFSYMFSDLMICFYFVICSDESGFTVVKFSVSKYWLGTPFIRPPSHTYFKIRMGPV